MCWTSSSTSVPDSDASASLVVDLPFVVSVITTVGVVMPRAAARMLFRRWIAPAGFCRRSEEHTSELQSPDHLVCRLLLEKKKNMALIHRHARRTTILLSGTNKWYPSTLPQIRQNTPDRFRMGRATTNLASLTAPCAGAN